MAETEEKKIKWGTVIFVGILILVVLLLIFVFRNKEDQDIPSDTQPIIDTEPVEIIVEEPEIANPAAVYCEEQGGEYLTEDETGNISECRIAVHKGNVFPWLIKGWEARGMICDEPNIDSETNKTLPDMVACYELTIYDAWEFFRASESAEVPEDVIEETNTTETENETIEI